MEIGNPKTFYMSIDEDKRLFFRMNDTITGIIVVILRMMKTLIVSSLFISLATKDATWTVIILLLRDGLEEVYKRTDVT